MAWPDRCGWCGQTLNGGGFCPNACDEECSCGSMVGDCSLDAPCPVAERFDAEMRALAIKVATERAVHDAAVASATEMAVGG